MKPQHSSDKQTQRNYRIDLLLYNSALWSKRISIIVLKQLIWNPFSWKAVKHAAGFLNFQRISVEIIVAVTLFIKKAKYGCIPCFLADEDKNKRVC